MRNGMPDFRLVPLAVIAAIPRTNFMENLPGLPDQSALTPANLTTLAHFSVSSAMSLPKSAGEPGRAVAAQLGKPRLHLGIGESRLISVLSLSTIGVFFGAPMPVQKLNS